jgi:tetratricopeptide (TPR) repeat protein
MSEQPSTRKFECIDSTLYSQYKNCDRWAVIVGISKYQHQDWNLKYAHRDAEELYQLLLTSAGGSFASDHIRLLVDEQATTKNIKKALFDFLEKPAKEDLVLIYFACHGSPNPDRPKNIYLLTHDTEPNAIAGTALPMDDIDRALKDTLFADKVIVLADTCHSGAIGGGIGGRRSVEVEDISKVMNRYFLNISQSKGGVAFLSSAEANQVSFEDTKWGKGHGVFTHFLLEGMRGAADTDNNGIVTIGELFEYVRDNVKQATDHKQHPSIGTNSYDRNMPVSITFITLAKQCEEEGLRLYKNGNLNDAISKLREAVKLNSSNGFLYFYLGDMLCVQGALDEAIKTYKEGLILESNNPDLWTHLGFLLHEEKRLDEAIEACNQAISLNPQLSLAYATRGEIYYDKQMIEKAILDYKKAIEIDKDCFSAHLNLGWILYEQKKFSEAIEELSESDRLKPNDPVILTRMGAIFHENGQNELAIEKLKIAALLYKKDNKNSELEEIESVIKKLISVKRK